jgi:hypothetical protein
MIRKIFRSLVILPLLTIPLLANHAISHSPAIRVRVLDASTEKPLAGIRIALFMSNDLGILGKTLNGKTDSNGIAVFDLPNEVPLRVGPRFAPDDDGLCSEVEFVTARIFDTGVVGKNYCKTASPSHGVTAEPGELVIFAKPISPWERILRELL